MPNDTEFLAEELYEAYCAAVGGIAFNGDKLPNWQTFRADPSKAKQGLAWIATADAAWRRLGPAIESRPTLTAAFHQTVCAVCNQANDLSVLIGTCPRCRESIDQLTKENDTLRGIAANVMPCHYCGVDSILKCPHGFPGCALADDILCAEDRMAREIQKLRAALKLFHQDAEQRGLCTPENKCAACLVLPTVA